MPSTRDHQHRRRRDTNPPPPKTRRRESTRRHEDARRPDSKAYQVIKTIGQGSEGRCDLLERNGDGKRIVCKKVHSFRQNQLGSDIPREVRILREILRPHPQIINLLSYNLSRDHRLEMYYDYYPGGDLLEQLRPEGGSSEPFVWHVFKQMTEALLYLHRGYTRSDPSKSGKMPHKWQPIVHCDLKPNNIFLTRPRTFDNPFPDLVLADFGFAVIGNDKTGGGCSTYKPPEYPLNSPASDVWALGAMIHQMGRGDVPADNPLPKWFSGTEREWVFHHKSKELIFLPALCYTPTLSRIMLECLILEPEYRISTYDLWRRIRKDEPR